MAVRGMSPADLDPLEAARAPITPDPRLGNPRVAQLVAEGIPPAEARRIAAEEEAVTPEQLRAMGLPSQAEPGQSRPGGMGKVPRGQQFDNVSEAADYVTRTPVTDANRHLAQPDAAYLPSPRDIDMRNRGFMAVYTPDGGVSYSVGTGSEMLASQDIADGRGIPGAPGRLGPREDLEANFDLVPVKGPNGTSYVYRLNEEARAKQDAYRQERMIARMADSAGMNEAELAAMTPEERRMAVRDRKRADAQERMDRWKSQMMLAGGRPTGGPAGTKAATNALMMLPEADRAQVLKDRMMPRGAGREDADFANKLALLRADMEARATEGREARTDAAEQRELDRQMRREERKAAEEEAKLRYAAERDQRNAEWKQRMEEFGAQRIEAQQRFDLSMGGQAAQLEALRQQGAKAAAEFELMRGKSDLERDKQDAALKQTAKNQELAFQQQSPGLYDIATGRSSTEAAIDALKGIAAQSDNFQWLPGGGFGVREATAMNDELLRLARQAELSGVQTRLNDPNYRRELIKRWGYSSGWSGGRGGWLGDFWQPMPADLQ